MTDTRLHSLKSWCSWCGELSCHTLLHKHGSDRPTFKCSACGLLTVKCRYCDNMARVVSGGDTQARSAGQATFCHRELCAEHDGSIPCFTKATAKIPELGDFKYLMRPRKTNLDGLGKRAEIHIDGAAVRAGKCLAAPGIAVSLGATECDDTYSALDGEALASASLSMVGSGELRIIAATGGGLGGKAGYGLANAYLHDIPDYHFTLKRAASSDRGHRVVIVNGFLSESDLEAYDWCSALADHYRDASLWYLNWEAKNLRRLGGIVSGGGRRARCRSVLPGRDGPASNPWLGVMLNAEKAGALLAEAISRTEGQSFTLLGHSLGARVIFFALLALASKGGNKYVKEAVMLGGAVGNDSERDWLAAASATSGGLYNCYSEWDGVLAWLSRKVDVELSTPAGLAPAPQGVKGVVNSSFSDLIGGHGEWKANLGCVLDRLGLGRVTTRSAAMTWAVEEAV